MDLGKANGLVLGSSFLSFLQGQTLLRQEVPILSVGQNHFCKRSPWDSESSRPSSGCHVQFLWDLEPVGFVEMLRQHGEQKEGHQTQGLAEEFHLTLQPFSEKNLRF